MDKAAFIKNPVALDDYKLVTGVGNLAAKALCVMSLAAVLAGEAHGDVVTCACPVVRAFAIRLNDRMGDEDRQKLKPVAYEILGTKGSRELELRRSFRCADWAVREVAAGAMEACGLVENAIALRGLAPVVDRETALAGKTAANAAANANANAAAAAAAAAHAAAYATAHAASNATAHAAADAAAAYAAAAYADAYSRSSINDRSIDFLRELCAMTEVSIG